MHGLLPDHIYLVTNGIAAALQGQKNLYLDVHELGKVSAKDVAEAHKTDLAVEQKYGVNFINYWVNEKEGVVMCLSEAPIQARSFKRIKKRMGCWRLMY